MKLFPLALAVTLTPSLTLAAQTSEPYQAPPLVVTRGTPLQQPAPASVAVITREEIENSAASSLIDVLRTQAGLQIRDTQGDGQRAGISLRGFGENAINNTLVLVDGRRLNVPALKGPDLNSVPLGNIERIEIIRGAGTVLYGDQAVGGVINIITRRSSQNEAYVETARGSHDLETYRGHLNQMLGAGFSLFASGESRQNDNYRDNNNASYSNLFTRLRYDHDLGWALYEYQTIDDELRYPGSLTLAQRRLDRKATSSPQDFNDNKTQVHRFALEQRLSDIWAANFDYSQSDQDGVGEFFGSFEEGLRIESFNPRLTARWDTTLGQSEWLFGHDHITSDYELSSTGTESRQTLRDWYTQFSQPLGQDLTLTLGYRASEAEDRDKGAGRTHTDREGSSSIGLSWQADTNTRLFLKREDVLRWANVNENAFVSPGIVFLKPQAGVSWESGLEWQDSRQRYQASLYRLDLKDELMYDPLAEGPGSPFGFDGANINLDKTRRQGLLLEGRRQLTDKLTLNGQYSFTNSEYLDGSFKGNEVPWVARHTASTGVTYQILSGLSTYIEAVYIGSRHRVSDDANEDKKEGGYTLWNAALTYEYQNFNSKLRVNNLTGKRYDAFAYKNATSINPAAEEDVQLSVGYRF